MKNKEDCFYNIKDLRIVMINKEYLEYGNNDYVNYFNGNVKFIVEKIIIDDVDKFGLPYFAEYYTECVTEEDLSVRVDNKEITGKPKIFSLVSKIPKKYFTKDELDDGKVSIRRIYKILQDINVTEKIKTDNHKVKKIGKR